VTEDGEPEAPELRERTVPVEVDGKRFSVKLWLPDGPAVAPTAPAAKRARPRPAAGGATSGAGGGTISAPMQGTIVKVLVSVGDAVETGQSVLVLEAMKMENHLNADMAGTVSEVRVNAGDTVGTGDVLLVIE
jgi:acetyl-CoA/propionyl-CoA carboxylase biotin carboxyl carrier protein